MYSNIPPSVLAKIRVLDRLLHCDNETINDILDQALLVARVVDPNGEKSTRGPIETVLQVLENRISNLENEKYNYSTPVTDNILDLGMTSIDWVKELFPTGTVSIDTTTMLDTSLIKLDDITIELSDVKLDTDNK